MSTKLYALCLAFTFLACSKPPKAASFGSGRASIGANSDQETTYGGIKDDGTTTGGYTGLACSNKDTHRGIRAWRRLSNIELKNTVADVFGVTTDVDYSSFVNDISKSGIFDTSMVPSNFVSTIRLKSYFSFAESLATKADLTKLFPCLSDGASCVYATLKTLGAEAWRRPLTAEELTGLNTVYDQLITDGYKNDEAARLMIQALVLSQSFLYRSELGEKQDDGSFLLTNWELASSLSYATIRTIPDSELKALAESSQLRNSDTLVKQATRLLNSPKAKIAWKDFGSMWLEAGNIISTDKIQAEFTPAVKNQLTEEIQNFFVDTMFSAPNRTYGQLLTADYTVGDISSSFIYGSTIKDGKISYKEPQRRGILGQAGFLASTAASDTPNPIKRGVFVLGKLLCSGFAPAPPTALPETKSGLSNKELFQQHSKGSCAGCHKYIDDFGFALENFDEIGKFRESDEGGPIAISGTVSIDGKAVTIASPEDLSEAIALSHQGMECFARQTFRYTLGRPEYAAVPIVGGKAKDDTTTESQLDRCQIDAATAAMKANGGDLKAAFLDFVGNPAFRLRLAGPKN